MTTAGCPDENALVRFSTGKLSGADLSGLEQHLDGCSPCRALIAQLASGAGESTVDLRPRPPLTQIGRYQVERLLGSGAMGVVYAGRDRDLNREVAIKLLRPTAIPQAESRARLLREAQTMARLSHPNLVPIFELGNDAGNDFLAMELVDGPTLDLWLREEKRDWKQIVRTFVEAGRGLEAAHEAGVVHRDFKPGNVLIGPGGRARVTDFGLARPDAPPPPSGADAAPVGITRAGALLGTPAYMSPEQLEGQVADVRSDQFSFCVALVEALTGQRPFAGRTVKKLQATMREAKPAELNLVPRQLRRALEVGLARDPDQRYGSIGLLLHELEAAIRPRPTQLALIALVGLSVIVVIGLGAAWAVRARSEPAAVPVAPPPPRVTELPKAPVEAPGPIELTVGQQRVLEIADVIWVSVGSPDIAEAMTVGTRQVLVIGKSAGRTTLLVWEGSKRLEYQVSVARPTEAEQKIDLFPGQQKVLDVPGIQRVAVGDSAIADVKTIGNNQLLVIGAGAGRTTLLIWTASTRTSYLVTVVGSGEPGHEAGTIELFPGQQRLLKIPGISRIAVGDSEIADVKTIGSRELLVTGTSPGRTTLLIWSGSKRIEYLVTVTASRPTSP